MDTMPSPPRTPSPNRTPADSQALAGLRVMLIDDSRTNQIIVGTLLAKSGIGVCCVDNGPMALELLERGECDIVLTDLQLPEMDGFEIARRIRQHPRLADLPVIALSGYTKQEQGAASVDAGINDYVTKPARLEDLLAVLAKWGRPRRDGAATAADGTAHPDKATEPRP